MYVAGFGLNYYSNIKSCQKIICILFVFYLQLPHVHCVWTSKEILCQDLCVIKGSLRF